MADRNTMQKEIIHRTLCGMTCHPTAAMVYDQVHRSHPTISRSTVYRVLARLAEEGKVLRLDLAGGDSRYDGQEPIPLPTILKLTLANGGKLVYNHPARGRRGGPHTS